MSRRARDLFLKTSLDVFKGSPGKISSAFFFNSSEGGFASSTKEREEREKESRGRKRDDKRERERTEEGKSPFAKKNYDHVTHHFLFPRIRSLSNLPAFEQEVVRHFCLLPVHSTSNSEMSDDALIDEKEARKKKKEECRAPVVGNWKEKLAERGIDVTRYCFAFTHMLKTYC